MLCAAGKNPTTEKGRMIGEDGLLSQNYKLMCGVTDCEECSSVDDCVHHAKYMDKIYTNGL